MTDGPLDGEDYFSSVSLSSSMCNNCPSIANTDISGVGGGGIGIQRGSESVSSSSVVQSPRRKGSPGKRKRGGGEEMDAMSVDRDNLSMLELDQEERAEDILPSGAEATMGSSSSSDPDLSEDDNEDGDDEGTSAPGAFRETFNSKAFPFPSALPQPHPQPQVPFPPMPMSLADTNGKFDFKRGQLPALLLSWYMSGYHAGYFDATQEKPTTSRGKGTEDLRSRGKRQ